MDVEMTLAGSISRRNLVLLLVSAAGLGLAAAALPRTPADRLPILLMLAGIAAVAERYGTTLFARTRVSASSIPVVAAAVICSAGCAVLPAIGVAAGSYLFRDRPFSRFAFNLGQQVIAAVAATVTLIVVQKVVSGTPGTVLGAGVAGLTHWSVSTPLVAIMISLDSRQSLRTTFRENFAWLPLHFVFGGLIGYGLAASYLEQGSLGVAIFTLPMVGFAVALRQAANKARPALSEAKAARENASELARLLRQRDELTAELRKSALLDPLTGLPNRSLFFDRLEALCAVEHRHAPAVAFIDLDRFKQVNDQFGHDAGDELLRVTAKRIESVLRASETVARYGGDEFVVLFTDRTETECDTAAKSVLASISEPIELHGNSVPVRASVGLARWNAGDEPSELVRRADVAVYRAKSEGRGRVVCYDELVDRDPLLRRDLEQELTAALANGDVSVAYQPLVDLDSGAILGFEALARWQHEGRGLLDPTTFVPLAEQTGQIVELGRQVLREACLQLKAWQSFHPQARALKMSVNVSPIQLTDPGFIATVRGILAETGINPAQLTLEVTESTVLADFDAATTALAALKALGLRFALDDFGTGYSSMSYLHQLPVDAIKLDRSFVTDLAADDRLRSVVGALHQVAGALGLDVIAEGIERLDDVEVLRAMGCRIGQGFHFARPHFSDVATQLISLPPDWLGQDVRERVAA